MKIIHLIAAVALWMTSSLFAVEKSILSAEFLSYEKSLEKLSEALRNEKEGLTEDERKVRFILSVYGEFMGHEQIEQTWQYIMLAQKMNKLEQFEIDLKKWSEKWKRKSILTLLEMYPNLDEEDRLEATLFVKRTEPNLGELEAILSDKKIMEFVKLWSLYSISKVNIKPEKLELKKFLYKDPVDELEISALNSLILKIKDGRQLTLSSGLVAEVEGGVFTGVSIATKKNAKFRKAVSIGSGFGRESIIWEDGSNEGGIQVLRGSRKEEGKETLFLFFKGALKWSRYCSQ